MPDVTYTEVGATRDGTLPVGYRYVRHRTRLPTDAFEAAGQAVLTWRMHRAAGIRIDASAPCAEPGVTVIVRVGLGPLHIYAPCQVVWSVQDSRRIGFGYGTLPGHPERGEEAFVVERDDDGHVWFSVTAFSRPARWFTRLAGPLAHLVQKAYAHWCARTLQRLSRRG